jgi:hypothetical protein
MRVHGAAPPISGPSLAGDRTEACFPGGEAPYPKKSIERARWVPLTTEIFEVSKGPVLFAPFGPAKNALRVV